MSNCNLCPRNCGINRDNNSGFCGVDNVITIAKAALHFWEEPCISGSGGSGTIFFSGCSLRCVFCQNNYISHKRFGKKISAQRFYQIMFELKEKGAQNINLVSADHFLDKILPIIKKAKNDGLDIPVILNTSSYLKTELLEKCKDIIDIYIADFKFFNNNLSKKYCSAYDYPQIAKAAINKMVEIIGNNEFVGSMMKRGVIVRILVIPQNIIDAKQSIKYILDTFGDKVQLSIMSQFTPCAINDFPELSRNISDYEYKSVVDFAVSHGFKSGYIQEKASSDNKFIPDFDLEGV